MSQYDMLIKNKSVLVLGSKLRIALISKRKFYLYKHVETSTVLKFELSAFEVSVRKDCDKVGLNVEPQP